MDRYIKVYDNVFSSVECNALRSFLDNAPDTEWKETPGYSFYQVHLGLEASKSVMGRLYELFAQRYFDDVLMAACQRPERISFEVPRIKKYPIGSEFKDHVDAINLDSSKRYLSFLVYLNTLPDGFTHFESGDVMAKEGRVVCFPPLWTYPHAGLPSTTGEKYILSGYLNFC